MIQDLNYMKQIYLYLRYVDDILLIWEHGENKLIESDFEPVMKKMVRVSIDSNESEDE